MTRELEIIFMQTRILRLASEKWHQTIDDTIKIFKNYKVAEFIDNCSGIFLCEGDDCVLDEVEIMLKNNGANFDFLYVTAL